MSIDVQLEIQNRVNYIQAAHINDPYSSKLLDEISGLLSEDEHRAMSFLISSNENILSDISTRLDEFAGRYPSKELLSLLSSLMDKFPDNHGIKSDCQLAIDIINEELLYLQQLKEQE